MQFRILVGKCCKIKNIGCIRLGSKGVRVHLGSQQLFNSCNSNALIFDNRGTIEIDGRLVIQPGVCLHTLADSKIVFHGNNHIGKDSSILSHSLISFGINTQVSWNCQISDTDFHFIKNLRDGKIKNNTVPIHIGEGVWIGNNVMIGKGVILEDNIIVGQGSKVYKSFVNPNKIIAGSPAVERDGEYQRIWNTEEERRLTEYFKNNNTSSIIIN